jgi:hypothetical protein
MPLQNPVIEAVLLLNPNTCESRILFESPVAGANEASEIWWETGTTNYFLYHPDEFYDDGLRDRRNTQNMISPRDNQLRLLFVGLAWGARTYDETWIVLTRGQILSKQ